MVAYRNSMPLGAERRVASWSSVGEHCMRWRDTAYKCTEKTALNPIHMDDLLDGPRYVSDVWMWRHAGAAWEEGLVIPFLHGGLYPPSRHLRQPQAHDAGPAQRSGTAPPQSRTAILSGPPCPEASRATPGACIAARPTTPGWWCAGLPGSDHRGPSSSFRPGSGGR